jgi:adenosylcobinamide-GDP ribazoletransferase
MSLMRSARTAFTLMTAVPLGGDPSDDVTPDVAAFFPWVGWAIGAVVILGAEALRSASAMWGNDTVLTSGGYLVGALIVGVTALMTRFLHWDGLADTADALWAPGTPERRGEIMADSATGAFGATAVALVAVTQVVSYGAMFAHAGRLGYVVFAVPVVGRAAATFAAWLGEPLRPEGLGARLMGRPGVAATLIGALGLGLPLALVWQGHESLGLVWSLAALLLAPLAPHLISKRIGGVNGDVMGASILITETLLLVVAGLGSTL